MNETTLTGSVAAGEGFEPPLYRTDLPILSVWYGTTIILSGFFKGRQPQEKINQYVLI